MIHVERMNAPKYMLAADGKERLERGGASMIDPEEACLSVEDAGGSEKLFSVQEVERRLEKRAEEIRQGVTMNLPLGPPPEGRGKRLVVRK